MLAAAHGLTPRPLSSSQPPSYNGAPFRRADDTILTLTPSKPPPVPTDRAPEHDLAHHLSLFSGVTVLVLGDVMLDRYVLGDVRRNSPEAPIPVLRAQRPPRGSGRRRQRGRQLSLHWARTPS